jgi:hypothetical protein
MVHLLGRSKLQIPCPQCFEILKPIGTQRFACDNPKCHLLEVTAIISYSDEKCETVYQYKRKEWVEGKTKSDYILLDREKLETEWSSFLRWYQLYRGDLDSSGRHDFKNGIERLEILFFGEFVSAERLSVVKQK